MRVNLKQRVAQVEAWLREHFPTPYPVIVRWSPRIAGDCFGDCYWSSPNVVVRLSGRRCRERAIAIETLLHEWAHAIVMPNERLHRQLKRCGALQEHPDEFWIAYGRIYRLYYDLGGCEESQRTEVA